MIRRGTGSRADRRRTTARCAKTRDPRRRRGFAMVVFLALTPIVTLMAWTFLKVGTVTRAQALTEERHIRSLFAAEAALRYTLYTGQPLVEARLNGCLASASVGTTAITAGAAPMECPAQGVHLSMDLDRGFISRRTTDEKN